MKLLILLALLLPQKTFVSNLIFLDGGQEIGSCQAAEDDTFQHPHYTSCTFKADGAVIVTKIMQEWRDSENRYNKCGDYGPWILDQNGKIMGRYRNPPCPK